MADVGLLEWPPHSVMAVAASVPAFTAAHPIDATTDECSWVFRAKKALTITTVLVRIASITGTPGTARIGIQSVSATTGAPTGTWLGGTATGYATVTSYGTAATFLVCTLAESVTVARGQRFAVVIDPQATGTWDASNLITVTYSVSGGMMTRVPYAVLNGVKTATTLGCVAVRTASETIGYAIETLPTFTPTTATTPDEIALKFAVASATCSTYQVVGARITANWTASRTFTLILYDSDGTTVLQNVDIDTDEAIAGQGSHDFFFDEPTLVTLNPGTPYRLSILAAATSAGVFSTWTTPTSGDMGGITPQTCQLSTRTDAGAWTDTATQAPCIQALISDMTVAAAGGLSAPKVGPGLLARAS